MAVAVVGFDKPQGLRVEWVLVSQQGRDSTREAIDVESTMPGWQASPER